MEVKLFKRTGTYFNPTKKKDIPFVNFYVQCNDTLIPVEVKYFPNSKTDNRDLGYSRRMGMMEACAELLPDKEAASEEETTAPADKEASSFEAPRPTESDIPGKT